MGLIHCENSPVDQLWCWSKEVVLCWCLDLWNYTCNSCCPYSWSMDVGLMSFNKLISTLLDCCRALKILYIIKNNKYKYNSKSIMHISYRLTYIFGILKTLILKTDFIFYIIIPLSVWCSASQFSRRSFVSLCTRNLCCQPVWPASWLLPCLSLGTWLAQSERFKENKQVESK